MTSYHFKLSDGRYTLSVEVGRVAERQYWTCTLTKGARGLLEFEVGEPICRTAEYGPVEAEIAASAVSFISEASAWDDESEREVCKDIGEDLLMVALARRDTLGRVVRRHFGN